MLSLRKPEGTEVAIASCSLVYEARHTLAQKAMNDRGTMKVIHANKIILEIFEVTGFADVLTIE